MKHSLLLSGIRLLILSSFVMVKNKTQDNRQPLTDEVTADCQSANGLQSVCLENAFKATLESSQANCISGHSSPFRMER